MTTNYAPVVTEKQRADKPANTCVLSADTHVKSSSTRRTSKVKNSSSHFSNVAIAEPSIRFSRAILIMLLLHIIAVGGFFVSSVIKEHDMKRTGSSITNPIEADDSFDGDKVNDKGQHKSNADSILPSKIHVVRQGETLLRIANDNGVTVAAIVAANESEHTTIPLKVGQEIRLPAVSQSTRLQPSNNQTDVLNIIEDNRGLSTPIDVNRLRELPDAHATETSRQIRKYIVNQGDTIQTIAQKSGVSAMSILKTNRISDTKKLQTGQTLIIPNTIIRRPK